jgi:prephenate dehydratase
VLAELSIRGIDLTRIESRPIKGMRDNYWFHLDCSGHVAQPAMGEALAALHRRCLRVRYLGSYPRSAPPDGPVWLAPVVGPGAERFPAATEWLAAVRAGTRS